MSTAVKRVKASTWSPKELKKQLRDVYAVYKQVGAGLSTVPPNPSYTHDTSSLALEIVDDLARFERLYAEATNKTTTKRKTSPKPKLCDKKLTDFLSSTYGVSLPSMGTYGICDVNTLAFSAISLYLREQKLNNAQFFTLDDKLTQLFKSQCVNGTGKSYLAITKDRVAELDRERGDIPKTPSMAEVIEVNGVVTMNYSALKIIVPKFVVEYELVDPDLYSEDMAKLKAVIDERQTK